MLVCVYCTSAVKVLHDLGIHRPKSAGRGSKNSSSSHTQVQRLPGSRSSRPGYLAPNPMPAVQQQQSALAILAKARSPAAAVGVRSSPTGIGSSNGIGSNSSSVGSKAAAVPNKSLQQQQRQQVRSSPILPAGSAAKRSGSSSSSHPGIGLLDTPVSLTASRVQNVAAPAVAAAAGGSSAGLNRKRAPGSAEPWVAK